MKWFVVAVSALLFVVGTMLFASSAEAGDKKDKKKRTDIGSAAQFKKLDTDENGKLSKEEFKKIEIGRKKAEGKEGRSGKIADKMFGELDSDKDGFLSPEEFKKLPDKLGELRKKKANKQGSTVI